MIFVESGIVADVTKKQFPESALAYAWTSQAQKTPRLLSATETQRYHWGLSPKLQLPYWVLDFTYTPAGLFRGGAKSQPWEERQAAVAHLYPPQFPFWEDTRPVARWVHTAHITFRDGELVGLNTLVTNRRGFARLLDPRQILGEKLREMARIGHLRGEAGFWQAHGVFFATVDMLLKSEPLGEDAYRVSEADREATEAPIVVEVRRFIEEHLAEAVSIERIATHLNVSVSTLSHQYKAACGETPMATRTRLALNVAKNLLLKGYALKQISEETGFCDVYHLSKVFKRVEGVSPRAYLQQRGKG